MKELKLNHEIILPLFEFIETTQIDRPFAAPTMPASNNKKENKLTALGLLIYVFIKS